MFDSLRVMSFAGFCIGLSIASALHGQATAAAGPPTAAIGTNEQAHALLDSARKINGLFGEDLKPWHLSATITLIWNEPKPVPEAVQVWSASQYRWRAVSERQGKKSTKWKLSRSQQFQSHEFVEDPWEPFSNPLSLADYLKPDIELQITQVNVGVQLDCVVVIHPERYKKQTSQEFFPSLCFDKSQRLRLLSYGQVVSQYASYRVFQGRTVAAHVTISSQGNLLTDCKLESLEVIDPIEQSIWKQDGDAIETPYTLAPGDPDPVILHSEAGPTYLNAAEIHPGRLILIPAVIQKNGSVSVPKDGQIGSKQVGGQITMLGATTKAFSASVSSAPRMEPMIGAAGRWKFEPYLVDGKAVQVSIMVPFTEDGRPWVPK